MLLRLGHQGRCVESPSAELSSASKSSQASCTERGVLRACPTCKDELSHVTMRPMVSSVQQAALAPCQFSLPLKALEHRVEGRAPCFLSHVLDLAQRKTRETGRDMCSMGPWCKHEHLPRTPFCEDLQALSTLRQTLVQPGCFSV